MNELNNDKHWHRSMTNFVSLGRFCNKSMNSFRKCPCRTVYYASEQCQLADWEKTHRNECRWFEAKQMTNAIRMSLVSQGEQKQAMDAS